MKSTERKNNMGIFISKLHKLFDSFSVQNRRILILGLDAAGKTTILYQLCLKETVTTIPTIGFNVETVRYRNTELTMFDIGGQDRIRPLWHHYYQGTDALIYVLDSFDKGRFEEASKELHRVLNDPQMDNVPLLVLANKADLCPNAPSDTIVQALQLHKERNRKWMVQSSIATKGQGLYEGLDWLNRTLQAKGK